ncbi:pilus assembly protein PilP [Marinospirillum sp.]|uniref:pilus assembly protein PilP n=1 Tax=Marinospirillum sp. TaxID=2183934 RepID=UPI00286FD1D8|nr:pilus assembly protein PilP [Marinospirillum sp.]MDR9468843.1 pilus assembly protein PilP [Marinospirillum sp.]
MKPNRLPLCKLLFAGLLLSLLSACSDQPRTAEIQQRLQELKERPSGQIDPVPDFPEAVTPQYTQNDQRDPFTPDGLLSDRSQFLADSSLAPDPSRNQTSLERWSLSELSLRGIMRKGQQTRALILTPEGKLAAVGVGDYLGQDHGRITDISSNHIKLVELIPDNLGGWQEREQELNLSR